MHTTYEQPSVKQDTTIWSLHYYLEIFPKDTNSRRKLAQRYAEHGAYRHAVREYHKLLCLDPHCYGARLELSDCYLALNMRHAAACELRLLTMITCYAQAAWQRLARIDPEIGQGTVQTDTEQHVWERLQR